MHGTLENGWVLKLQLSSISRPGKLQSDSLCQRSGSDLHVRSTRPTPLEVHLQSFNVPHFPSLMLAMVKPTYVAITEMAEGKPAIIFVPSRKQCRLTANDLLGYCLTDSDPTKFLNIDVMELQPHLEHIQDQDLAECLKHGIGYYHEALSKQDKRIVASLMNAGAIRVLVASKVCAHSFDTYLNTLTKNHPFAA